MPTPPLFVASLILLAVAGLAAENFAHYPIAILSLIGIVHWLREPREIIANPSARLVIAIFLCVWLPMLFALPDAENFSRSLKTTMLYLHFLPACLYVLAMLRDPKVQRIVATGIAGLVALWCIDGGVQFFTGHNLLGYPHEGAVLTGVFYPKQRLGLILAVFAPLYLHVVVALARQHFAAWLLLLPFLFTIILSLKRTAWIMLVVGLGLYLISFVRASRTNLLRAALILSLFVASMAAAVSLVPTLRGQISDTIGIFSSDFETADIATSRRLSLWKTGIEIAAAHWINGVGPRGYRTVYRQFASTEDFWMARESKGQTHPHLMLLEVLIETGVIGVVGYLLALALLLRYLRRARHRDRLASAYIMVVLVAWFPLNAHLAFYGSYWSNIAWLAIALAALGVERTQGDSRQALSA